MNSTPYIQKFKILGCSTIIAVYVLILVGGIVRASGAGLGCPDWPTCFGRWVPPTSEAQLPANYQTIYANLGYANTRFNVTKTWTEYLNRLTGVSIGFLIFLTVVYSRYYRKKAPRVFYCSLATFFLVGFQGWLGARVVESGLLPGMITLHMLVALLIVALLIYAITRSQITFSKEPIAIDFHPRFKTVLLIAMAMTLIQVIMGTQVRESVDTIATAYQMEKRELWRAHFPIIFYIHRSFSALILITNLWLIWNLLKKVNRAHYLFRCAFGLGFFIVSGILTGITMDRLDIPAVAQPVHLLMATLVFGMQFFLFISLANDTASKESNIRAPRHSGMEGLR